MFLFGCAYSRRWLWFLVSLFGVGLAMILAAAVKTAMPPLMTAAPIVPDAAMPLSAGSRLIAALVLLFVSWAEVTRGIAAGTTGACWSSPPEFHSPAGPTTSSLFLALELISIPTYVLLYLPARTRLNQEAAAKYFLLSVLSSAVLLFGFSYLYGLTGSTNIAVITDTLSKAHWESRSNGSVVSPMAAGGDRPRRRGDRVPRDARAVPLLRADVYEGGPAESLLTRGAPKLAGFVAARFWDS